VAKKPWNTYTYTHKRNTEADKVAELFYYLDIEESNDYNMHNIDMWEYLYKYHGNLYGLELNTNQ